jgi:CheY-specific phosphatase CheX
MNEQETEAIKRLSNAVRRMRARLDEQCIIHANSQFWEQMLAMTLDPSLLPGKVCLGPGHIIASVDLCGNWKGRVELRMAGGLAYEATAAMMMQPLETVAEADALDATREIANMIAGSIKSSLPRPCSMAVPESAVASSGFCGHGRTEDTLVVAFSHPAGDLMVRVWEEECLLEL